MRLKPFLVCQELRLIGEANDEGPILPPRCSSESPSVLLGLDCFGPAFPSGAYPVQEGGQQVLSPPIANDERHHPELQVPLATQGVSVTMNAMGSLEGSGAERLPSTFSPKPGQDSQDWWTLRTTSAKWPQTIIEQGPFDAKQEAAKPGSGTVPKGTRSLRAELLWASSHPSHRHSAHWA